MAITIGGFGLNDCGKIEPDCRTCLLEFQVRIGLDDRIVDVGAVGCLSNISINQLVTFTGLNAGTYTVTFVAPNEIHVSEPLAASATETAQVCVSDPPLNVALTTTNEATSVGSTSGGLYVSGDTVTYLLTVTNSGTTTATGVSLIDIVEQCLGSECQSCFLEFQPQIGLDDRIIDVTPTGCLANLQLGDVIDIFDGANAGQYTVTELDLGNDRIRVTPDILNAVQETVQFCFSNPSGTVVDSPSQGSYDPETGDWLIGNLGPGASATITLSTSVSRPCPLLINNATTAATADQPDSNGTLGDILGNSISIRECVQCNLDVPTVSGGFTRHWTTPDPRIITDGDAAAWNTLVQTTYPNDGTLGLEIPIMIGSPNDMEYYADRCQNLPQLYQTECGEKWYRVFNNHNGPCGAPPGHGRHEGSFLSISGTPLAAPGNNVYFEEGLETHWGFDIHTPLDISAWASNPDTLDFLFILAAKHPDITAPVGPIPSVIRFGFSVRTGASPVWFLNLTGSEELVVGSVSSNAVNPYFCGNQNNILANDLWHLCFPLRSDLVGGSQLDGFSGPAGTAPDAPPIEADRCYRIRMEMRFGAGGTGFFRLFMDGILVVDQPNITLGYRRDNGTGSIVMAKEPQWGIDNLADQTIPTAPGLSGWNATEYPVTLDFANIFMDSI